MLRILVSAILYFITMFTEAQEKQTAIQDWNYAKGGAFVEHVASQDCRIPLDVNMFHKPKFEVNNKDVTFEIRF